VTARRATGRTRRSAIVLGGAVLALVLSAGSGAHGLSNPVVHVTATGDAPDKNPADGVCKTALFPAKGGPKAYCTLRAAVSTVSSMSGNGPSLV
jgi:hypothetical protein